MMYLIGILGFVVAFGLAVFIHELGHFLAAKLFKVPVERFVIGMDREAMSFLPPCLIEWKWGETTYGIAPMPLGGYVKMSGVIHPEIERYLEGGDAKPAPDTLQGQAMQDMGALYRRPFYQKFIIYVAGVTCNLILAGVVIVALKVKGVEVPLPSPAKISWIAPDGPYAGTPLKQGDVIVAVNSIPVKDDDEMVLALNKVTPVDAKVTSATLTMLRDTTKYDFPLLITNNDEKAVAAFTSVFRYNYPYIDYVIPNQPADKAGIRSGDTIVAINGEPMEDWTEFQSMIRHSFQETLTIDVRHSNGEQASLQVTPWEHSDEKGIGAIGVVPGNPNKIVERESLGAALMSAPGTVIGYVSRYVGALRDLGKKVATGNVKAAQRELGGPVGIAQMAYRQAQQGFSEWLHFLMVLNIALAVMNLLPFPVLDGGHICFAMYEGIFRRPVPPRILVPMLNGAVVFIIVFFCLVTFNDLFKILI